MKKIIASIGLWMLPLFAFAQFGSFGGNPFLDILVKVKAILNAVIPIVITIALIWFIWGVAKYVTAKEDEDKDAARDVMVYGVIGLFVIVSVWGIVLLLVQFTGIQAVNAPPTGIPTA